jgi:hypothetical protein
MPAAAQAIAAQQSPRSVAPPLAFDWRVRAVAAWEADRDVAAGHLRGELTSRLFALTSRDVPSEATYANPADRVAVTRLDGVLFRLADAELSIVRPCVHCGTGEFTSRPLYTRSDLGYALSDWQPRHANCQIEDAPDW